MWHLDVCLTYHPTDPPWNSHHRPSVGLSQVGDFLPQRHRVVSKGELHCLLAADVLTELVIWLSRNIDVQEAALSDSCWSL